MGHATDNRRLEVGNVRKLVGIVRLGENGFGKILANLGDVHVDAQCEFDITDVIPPETSMHDARDVRIVCGVFVELNSLNERGGAVPYADKRYTYFFVCHELLNLLMSL
jgi:hypothetical protein